MGVGWQSGAAEAQAEQGVERLIGQHKPVDECHCVCETSQ